MRGGHVLRITEATTQQAPLVHAVMIEAFEEYRDTLDPPSGALSESVDGVRQALKRGGAVLAWAGEIPIASARFELRPRHLYAGRVSVLPAYRGNGIAGALMAALERIARDRRLEGVLLGVRMSLTSNLALYRSLGYRLTAVEQHPKGNDNIGMLIKELI